MSDRRPRSPRVRRTFAATPPPLKLAAGTADPASTPASQPYPRHHPDIPGADALIAWARSRAAAVWGPGEQLARIVLECEDGVRIAVELL